MTTPDEVEKITDSVGIVPQPNEEHDETGDNADGVVADLPEESARVPIHSVQIARMFNAPRRRKFPIFILPQFVNVLVKFLIWRDHYRVYQWYQITSVEVQALYHVNFENLSWCVKGYGIAVKHKNNASMFCVFYFTQTHWTLVFKRKMRTQEKI